jgi:hypothetical protein
MDVTLHIIAEGQTEATFVNHTLKPHLARFSLDVHVLVVTTRESPNFTHRGGIGNYTKPERDIRLLLSQHSDMDVRFTTMFDLYQLPNDFPGYAVAASHNDPYRRVQTLEDALAEDIGDSRFFPYIQLYEFEALLLSDPQKFESQYDDCVEGISNLVAMASQFQSPELVNDDNPPSKRINQELLNYNSWKNSVGPIVAGQIGLPTLRSACPHFAEWLGKLENLGK